MIYFDNAASSYPKPTSVTATVNSWLRKNGANPGRSSHKPAIEAAGVIFDARKLISDTFGAPSPECIAFVPNATYGLNILIQGLLSPGDHAVTTELEHNSVLRPLNLLRAKGIGYDVATVDLYDDEKTLANILKLIRSNTKLVVCTHCSNVCGKIMPVKKLSMSLPDGIRLVVDGAQSAGIIPINLVKDGIDYYCAPSHKGLLGPQGSGFIAVCSDMPKPIIVGGTGSESFNLNQPDYPPDIFESGTLPAGVIKGMAEGIKYINSVGIENIYKHKLELTDYALMRLARIDNIILYVKPEHRGFVGTVCFNVKDRNSDEVAAFLADNDICVRSGIHCAPLFHKKMGTEATGMVRISFSIFNTVQEIDTLIRIIKNF